MFQPSKFTRFHRIKRGLVAALVFSLALPLSAEAIAETASASIKESVRPTAGGYTRLLKKTDGTYASQYVNRTFVPANGSGPQIMLISAIHIGSQSYYDALQKLLDAQDVLLFEGISEHPDDFKKRHEDTEKSDAGLYGRLAKALGLIPQIKGLNYDRAHFLNADLSPARLKQILDDEVKKGGEEGKAAQEAIDQFKELTELLSGRSGGMKGTMIRMLISLIEFSPVMRDMVLLKLTEAGAGETSKFKSERLDALIIHDRNDAAISVLQEQLKKMPAPKTIGIFYGANHLADMEKTLVESLGYRPVDKDIWLTAFTFDPAKSKLKEKDIKKHTANANVVEEKPEAATEEKPATAPTK